MDLFSVWSAPLWLVSLWQIPRAYVPSHIYIYYSISNFIYSAGECCNARYFWTWATSYVSMSVHDWGGAPLVVAAPASWCWRRRADTTRAPCSSGRAGRRAPCEREADSGSAYKWLQLFERGALITQVSRSVSTIFSSHKVALTRELAEKNVFLRVYCELIFKCNKEEGYCF